MSLAPLGQDSPGAFFARSDKTGGRDRRTRNPPLWNIPAGKSRYPGSVPPAGPVRLLVNLFLVNRPKFDWGYLCPLHKNQNCPICRFIPVFHVIFLAIVTIMGADRSSPWRGSICLLKKADRLFEEVRLDPDDYESARGVCLLFPTGTVSSFPARLQAAQGQSRRADTQRALELPFSE